ncbi:unnamed protein product [Caenorhabditis sp. 36 PRJEB53466]|nr:unnamed protein product [Caenorhabditis sp. 36 PRJEB53466]
MTVEYIESLRTSKRATSSPPAAPLAPLPPSAKAPTAPVAPPPPTQQVVHFQVNPMLQQYMAYQQLAQISMYSQMCVPRAAPNHGNGKGKAAAARGGQ